MVDDQKRGESVNVSSGTGQVVWDKGPKTLLFLLLFCSINVFPVIL